MEKIAVDRHTLRESGKSTISDSYKKGFLGKEERDTNRIQKNVILSVQRRWWSGKPRTMHLVAGRTGQEIISIRTYLALPPACNSLSVASLYQRRRAWV